ncbi:hypothetical protein C882_0863 [Caenispirillum salinarum AK4]|uniref:Coenzyme PQQ synthesis protein A n=1 Tax=Caenispirillum salinarum AK4 TaxID=1238182 RepID=K9HJ88_9PROT|nr:pyrroloquinoline quinone precursor peptide PqqA [Caenispirillum salinarum]EKV28651.1 hypothetical protein C882_0863 [Caenispirillum salinarum AK4]
MSRKDTWKPGKDDAMKTWKKPKFVEIMVGLEINSYACAED